MGGVPHSRVILTWPGATGDFAQWSEGVVVQAFQYEATDPNYAYGLWGGGLLWQGMELEVLYSWECVDKGGGEAVTRCAVNQTFVAELWDGYRTYVPLRPAESMPFQVGLPGYETQLGITASKVDVPEWSDVVSRWPNAIETIPVLRGAYGPTKTPARARNRAGAG